MPKRVLPLTDKEVSKAKPDPTKEITMFDGGGLYLLITPSGGKLWRLKYRFNGKMKLISLGSYPEISLSDAREARNEAKKLIANGIDPHDLRQKNKALNKEIIANTFESVAREWHLKYSASGRWSPTHAADVLHRLEKDIFPPLGSRPISEIKQKDLLEALERVASRGALDTAHRLRHHCGMIFRHAVIREKASRDITVELAGALPPVKNDNHAAFTQPHDVASLLRAVDEYEGSYVVKCALKMLTLVWCRPGELRAAEWSEFDFNNAMWDIPAERMKMKKPHLVPLSHQAIQILEQLHPLTGEGRYLFPSHRSPLRCMSDNALNAALRRMGFTKEEMTAHGCRAMAKTMLRERLKTPLEYIELQLSHLTKDPHGNAYDRVAFLDERIQMMQTWADYLDELKTNPPLPPSTVPK